MPLFLPMSFSITYCTLWAVVNQLIEKMFESQGILGVIQSSGNQTLDFSSLSFLRRKFHTKVIYM